MLIAGVVPHLEVWGGVRRYLEIGNAMVDAGHQYHLYVLNPGDPWIQFKGEILPFKEHENYQHDIVFSGASECMHLLEGIKSDHKVILVVSRSYKEKYLDIWRKFGREYIWVGANHGWRGQFCGEVVGGFTVPGGVNTKFFKPDHSKRGKTIRVSYYCRPQTVSCLYQTEEAIKKFASDYKPGWEFFGYDKRLPGYQVEGVTFTACHSQFDLLGLLQSSHLVLSLKEGGIWNNNIVEGMACGCAAICKAHESSSFFEVGKTGRIAVDEIELYGCLVDFYKHPDWLLECGRNACEVIQDYSWDIYCRKLLEVVEVWKSQRFQ